MFASVLEALLFHLFVSAPALTCVLPLCLEYLRRRRRRRRGSAARSTKSESGTVRFDPERALSNAPPAGPSPTHSGVVAAASLTSEFGDFLVILWSLLFIYWEVVVHYHYAAQCNFPTLPRDDAPFVVPLRVLVTSDIQVADWWAFPMWCTEAEATGRNCEPRPLLGLFLPLMKLLGDLQLRRSYDAVVHTQRPDMHVNVGDMMHGPKDFPDPSYWYSGVQRIERIFGGTSVELTERQEQIRREMVRQGVLGRKRPVRFSLPTIVAPGNHDLSMYVCQSPALSAHPSNWTLVDGWEENFGPLQYRFRFQNFSFVVVPSSILMDNRCSDHFPYRTKAVKFLETLETKNVDEDVVLISHIPVNKKGRWPKPPAPACGPRAFKVGDEIQWIRGKTYINLMDYNFSDTLKTKLSPLYILSGDHHDLCEVYHGPNRTMPEMTVPAFSWQQGTNFHGYALMTLGGRGTVATEVCWQPQQNAIFALYGACAIWSLVIAAAMQGFCAPVMRCCCRSCHSHVCPQRSTTCRIFFFGLIAGTAIRIAVVFAACYLFSVAHFAIGTPVAVALLALVVQPRSRGATGGGETEDGENDRDR